MDGMQLFQAGDRAGAIKVWETAVADPPPDQTPLQLAEALNNLGVAYRLQRNYAKALTSLHKAEKQFDALGDKQRQGQALGNIADIYAAQREYDSAAASYSVAADLFAEANDPAKQSQILRALSLMNMRRWQWIRAVFEMEMSLNARPHLSPPQRLFRWLIRLFSGVLGR